jgi:hypothetical protein
LYQALDEVIMERGDCDMNDKDFAWLTEHGTDICEKYAGKWIAVYDGLVVGVGDTAVEAAAQAKERVGERDFILEAVDREADVIYGCA